MFFNAYKYIKIKHIKAATKMNNNNLLVAHSVAVKAKYTLLQALASK